MSMFYSTNSKQELINEINTLEERLQKINCIIESIDDNDKRHVLDILDENEKYEIPMPLVYNLITQKNYLRQKSKRFTQKLIKKLKSRKSKKSRKITNEIFEEIEIPYVDYE